MGDTSEKILVKLRKKWETFYKDKKKKLIPSILVATYQNERYLVYDMSQSVYKLIGKSKKGSIYFIVASGCKKIINKKGSEILTIIDKDKLHFIKDGPFDGDKVTAFVIKDLIPIYWSTKTSSKRISNESSEESFVEEKKVKTPVVSDSEDESSEEIINTPSSRKSLSDSSPVGKTPTKKTPTKKTPASSESSPVGKTPTRKTPSSSGSSPVRKTPARKTSISSPSEEIFFKKPVGNILPEKKSPSSISEKTPKKKSLPPTSTKYKKKSSSISSTEARKPPIKKIASPKNISNTSKNVKSSIKKKSKEIQEGHKTSTKTNEKTPKRAGSSVKKVVKVIKSTSSSE